MRPSVAWASGVRLQIERGLKNRGAGQVEQASTGKGGLTAGKQAVGDAVRQSAGSPAGFETTSGKAAGSAGKHPRPFNRTPPLHRSLEQYRYYSLESQHD